MDMTQQKINILVITPTILKNFEELSRCVKSVENQALPDNISVHHLIVYDGFEKDMPEIFFDFKNLYRDIISTNQEKSNTWGAYPRQFGIDMINSNSGFFGNVVFDYVLFLDDDNYLFPEYVNDMFNAITQNDADTAICKIYHHGPVNTYYNNKLEAVNTYDEVVAVISGNPPHLFNIDTLNVMFKSDVWKNNKWVTLKGNDGYLNDGNTYQKILKDTKNCFVHKILAIHY